MVTSTQKLSREHDIQKPMTQDEAVIKQSGTDQEKKTDIKKTIEKKKPDVRTATTLDSVSHKTQNLNFFDKVSIHCIHVIIMSEVVKETSMDKRKVQRELQDSLLESVMDERERGRKIRMKFLLRQSDVRFENVAFDFSHISLTSLPKYTFIISFFLYIYIVTYLLRSHDRAFSHLRIASNR